jgi:hypothetical protein
MAIAISSTIENWRFRFVNGPAGQFFRWWGEELGKLMPAQFRARMQYARRRLLVQTNDSEVALSVEDDGKIQSLDVFSAVVVVLVVLLVSVFTLSYLLVYL